MPQLSAESRSSLEAAVTTYEANLDLAATYLAGRGIDLEVARRARLGVVSEPEPGHGSGRGRLSIPYLTKSGPVAIKFRCTEPHDCREVEGHQKYAAPAGQTARLYNVPDLFADSDVIALTEGELDALVLSGQCGIPAVGIPGVSNWKNKRHYPRMFSGYSRVLVYGDPDDAGKELARRICDSLSQAVAVDLPADVNETYLRHGKDFLRKAAGL